jgi:VIT1/CCC1 family predicted Fe2+/Mn2+ transporter
MGWPRAILEEPTQLFRRYFVNTVFDSTFVILGILAATTAEPALSVDFALGTMFAASLAIGISTGVSVYEAEHTEGELRLRRLERAMLSPMGNTEISRGLRASRLAISGVNFLAPLIVASITSIPLLLFRAGWLGDFFAASLVSSVLGISIIFGAGYFLGYLTGRPPWRKAVRMSAIALLTFAALLLLERTL